MPRMETDMATLHREKDGSCVKRSPHRPDEYELTRWEGSRYRPMSGERWEGRGSLSFGRARSSGSQRRHPPFTRATLLLSVSYQVSDVDNHKMGVRHSLILLANSRHR